MSSRALGQRHRSSPMCRLAMPCGDFSTSAIVSFLPSLSTCFGGSRGKLRANEPRPTDGSATVQPRNDKQDYRPAVRLPATWVLRRVAMMAITKLLAGAAAAATLFGAAPAAAQYYPGYQGYQGYQGYPAYPGNPGYGYGGNQPYGGYNNQA